MTAVDFLTQRFADRRDATAVVAPAGSCSYGELAAQVRDRAAQLADDGVGEGTVVGLEGDFTPVTIALFLALLDRGAIVVPSARPAAPGADRRAALAQLEVDCRVDERERTRLARTGRAARHELYSELGRRRHPGLVQFSSGSSGEPKAAIHDATALLEKFELRRPPFTTLAFLPFDHLGGVNTMLHTLANGGTLVSTPDRAPETVCRLVERHGVELLPATPTFFNLLLRSGAHRRHDLSSLRVISYGAEPMPDTTLARLRDAFPDARLQQTYGMSELGALRTKSRDDGSLWVRVGGEGVKTRVVDGQLEVKARSMFLGYLNAPSPITEDGWLRTGDMVEQEGDFLRFLGRASDLINVGGEKVYPAEVENVIESMDGVAEAVVYGEPNGIVGQIVCARVRPEATESTGDLRRDVKRFCRERLERFKVPVKVELVADFGERRPLKKPRPHGRTDAVGGRGDR